MEPSPEGRLGETVGRDTGTDLSGRERIGSTEGPEGRRSECGKRVRGLNPRCLQRGSEKIVVVSLTETNWSNHQLPGRGTVCVT